MPAESSPVSDDVSSDVTDAALRAADVSTDMTVLPEWAELLLSSSSRYPLVNILATGKNFCK